ncbi:mitochondrial carrier domain-containing protein [Naematelia encephala]|uniref:Mitochondrial carrier domain-containing protein n=1 Tax=Naematelia encephala TaxID=71784 RepID=A0A1Y2B8V1_9TREE|nr:mitochondrial carrier domain-containing protein [Naematelia encephala]
MSTSSVNAVKDAPANVPTPAKSVQAPLSLGESFAIGGLAGCAAVTVSNIPETAKTRLQLQGELQRADKNSPKVYKNALDALAKTWRHEGIRGLQRGLLPAYGYQILLNGSRLGFYEPIRRGLNRGIGRNAQDSFAPTALTAGALTGCIGATLGSPLFLVKARIQAYSPALPVGAQHKYNGTGDALRSILKSDGVLGLWRGVNTAILRTACGSSVQLPSYNIAKDFLIANSLSGPSSFMTYLIASSFSGVCVCAAMQPADVALTRMYVQHTARDPVTGKVKGQLYGNAIEALWKTFRAEGLGGLYKGTTAHFLRIFPHTVLTLTCNDLFLRQYQKWRRS